jgi:segregation and condensation protein B
MKTKLQIESLLFISGRPMSVNKLSEILKKDKNEVTTAAEELMQDYDAGERGVRIQKVGASYQMATDPGNTGLVKDFVKAEQTGELTKPSLETLTIVAYRGPITKAELEQVRGVNCSLIIRNLLIKGLIDQVEDKDKMATVYTITFDFLRFLGLNKVEELPEYTKLNSDENLKKLLEQKVEAAAEPVPSPENTQKDSPEE